MQECPPGSQDVNCVNRRQYFQVSFAKQTPFHKPTLQTGYERQPDGKMKRVIRTFHDNKLVHTIDPETNQILSTASTVDQSDSNAMDPIISIRPRPLKQTSTLTKEQFQKGMLVDASYDHAAATESKINAGMTRKQAVAETNKANESELLEGLDGYKLDKELSTDQYVVVEKDNKVTIVFRGRRSFKNGEWDPTDEAHLDKVMRGQTRDYSDLDELISNIFSKHPELSPDDVDVVSYSNGGPKGLYLGEKYGLKHYSIDPVLGPKEAFQLTKRTANSPDLNLVRTTRPAVGMSVGTTAQQVFSGKNEPANTKIINVEPIVQRVDPSDVDGIDNPVLKESAKTAIKSAIVGVGGHDTTHYTNASGERVKLGLVGRNLLGSVGAGILPGMIASSVVDSTMQNADPQVKLASTAALTAGSTQVISPLLGAGGVAASEIVLPIYSSLETANEVGKAVDKALPPNVVGPARSMVVGGSEGAVGGATYGATSALQTAATTTASNLMNQGTVTAASDVAGVEMSELGAASAAETGVATTAGIEGTEMATLGGAAAVETAAAATAATVAAEEFGVGAAIAAGAGAGAASLSELGPLAAAGAVVGAAVGGVTAAVQANQNRPVYGIAPMSREGSDRAIAQDNEIIELIKSYNDKGDYSAKAEQDVISKIKARIKTLNPTRGADINYGQNLRLMKVNKNAISYDGSALSKGVVIKGDYSKIQQEKNASLRQRQQAISLADQPSEQASLRELLDNQNNPNYSQKSLQILDKYKQQRKAGTLPAYLETTFKNYENRDVTQAERARRKQLFAKSNTVSLVDVYGKQITKTSQIPTVPKAVAKIVPKPVPKIVPKPVPTPVARSAAQAKGQAKGQVQQPTPSPTTVKVTG